MKFSKGLKRNERHFSYVDSLSGTKVKLPKAFISSFVRFAWSLLAITACVYLWILIESLSLSHKNHVTTRDKKLFLENEKIKTTPSRPTLQTVLNHTDSTSTNKRFLAHQQPYVTPIKDLEKSKMMKGSFLGLYLNEPVDEHKYKLIHNPSLFCRMKNSKPKSIFLLIMIPTAPKNIEQRNVLRRVYGAENAWPRLSKGTIETVFLLGKPIDATLQGDINKEAAMHGDIVQEDFVDSYENLTIKTVMGLKWVSNYCRHARYVMKNDDDSVIIQFRFFTAFVNSPSSNWAAGLALFNSPVARNTSDKFFLSKDFYRSPTYPPYLNGPGYILSTDLVERTYQVALTTPIFPWEDVFIGMCLQKLGVVPQNVDSFLMIAPKYWAADFKTDWWKPLWVKKYSLISNVEPEYISAIWDAGRLHKE
ncbi:beta-1,3-galactosyltransferase 1-like [Lytechinus variegatus]|uniref:beta-1,3-galactosyltransferase 1-like n=1 Tax=Lytechinus variegatus TaxID=7654 RepID=UPI001BB0F866|nr:beta-1,3-galactosyltransferase 1-like [Lytechinus variegatus]